MIIQLSGSDLTFPKAILCRHKCVCPSLILISEAFSYKDQIESNFFDFPLMFPKGEEIFCIPLSAPWWCGEPWDSSMELSYFQPQSFDWSARMLHIAQCFGNVSQSRVTWFTPQESHPIFQLLLISGVRTRVGAHHNHPSPLLSEAGTSFPFYLLPCLSALTDSEQSSSWVNPMLLSDWECDRRAWPHQVASFQVALFSFPKGWRRTVVLAYHAQLQVSISLVSLYASAPGFGTIISSSLDWLPFTVCYAPSSPSSLPLIVHAQGCCVGLSHRRIFGDPETERKTYRKSHPCS